ncbi:hypothetical protein CR513_47657, partial [Mucuna pruriens]
MTVNGCVELGKEEKLSTKDNNFVQIKMYDVMIKTFDAWYVPSLQYNKISIDTLDKQGCCDSDEREIAQWKLYLVGKVDLRNDNCILFLRLT